MGKKEPSVVTVNDASEGNGGGMIQLKKQLGLMNGVGIIVGIIVGSGIFVSPKGVLLEAGSVGLCLMVWALTGVICCVGSICYAELGTCILTSGADYGYIMQAYGDLPAFLFLWVCLVVMVPTGNAITALTFANYVLQPVFPGCGAPSVAVTLLAALCISESSSSVHRPTSFSEHCHCVTSVLVRNARNNTKKGGGERGAWGGGIYIYLKHKMDGLDVMTFLNRMQ